MARERLATALLGPLLAACAADGVSVPAEAPPRDVVVLVHGMGRTPLSMLPLERLLEREGYEVLNFGYPSTQGVAELGGRLAAAVAAHPRADGARMHFVGHSLGNVLVRWVLAHQPPPSTGRVVMLAPPNRGAQAADTAQPWLGWLLAPLADLGTGEHSLARTLVLPAGVEVGVIAGGLDGKVTVDESHLDGETGHVVVPALHSFLMYRGDVQRLTLEFLRTGRFGGP